MRIFSARSFDRFARKERIGDAALVAAVAEMEAGLTGAELGAGLFKKRIARSDGGKSGGYRFVFCYRAEDRAVFLLGYAKNVQGTLAPAQEAVVRFLANRYLAYSETEISAAVADGELREIGK